MAAQRSSIAVGVARAGLTLATAFALTRVFAGRSWLFVMVLAAVAPPAFLGWAQRRHWHALVRLAVVAVGGIWLSALVVDPKTTVLGVPTRATISSLAHAIGHAPHTLRSAIVPVAPVGSALVLAFLGVFVAAALTAWIATSLDAPIGAFAPSIALFIVVAAMGGGGWVAPTALYALAALAYLLALAQHDLVARRTWFHAARPRGSRIAAGGAVVGALAIVVSLAVGPSVPGAGGSPLLDYRALGRGNTEGSLLSAPPPILQHPGQAHPGSRAGAVHREVGSPRVLACDRARLVHRRQRVGCEQGDRAQRVDAHAPGRTTCRRRRRFTSSSTSSRSTRTGSPPRTGRSRSTSPPRASCPTRSRCSSTRRSRSARSSTTCSPRSRPRPQALPASAPSDPNGMLQDLELPSAFPQSVRTLAEQVTQGRRTRTNARSAPAVLPRRHVQVHARDQPRRLPRRDHAVPAEDEGRLLRAVRRVVRGDGASVGVPARVAVGYQPGTLGRRRPLPRDEPQRARVARGVDRRRGLDPVRADTGVRRADARARTGGPQPAAEHRRPRRRPPSARPDAFARRLPTVADHPGGAGERCRRSRRPAIATVGHGGRRRAGRAGRGRVHRAGAPRDRALRTLAPQLSAAERPRSPPARARRVGRGARRAPRRRRVPRDRRRPRSSSRCATHRARRR